MSMRSGTVPRLRAAMTLPTIRARSPWVRTPRGPGVVAELPVARTPGAVARASGAVAAAPWRAHEDAVATLQHVLAAMVDLLAVDAHVAQATRGACREAGGGETRPLRHKAHHDGADGAALEEHVLAEPAALAPVAARAGTQALVAEEEWAIALGHFHGCAGDVAGPGEHVLPILGGGGAHATVEEEHVRVGTAIVPRARLRHRPQGRARARHHLVGDDLMQRPQDEERHVVARLGSAHHRRGELRVEETPFGRLHLDRAIHPFVVGRPGRRAQRTAYAVMA